MPDQLSLFDLTPETPAPQETPRPQEGLSTTPLPHGTDLLLPRGGRSGNPDDAVIQALRAAGIGLEQIVDIVTGGVEAPPLNTVDRGEVIRWVERAADRIIDPYQGRRLRRTVLDLLDAQFHLDYHARVHARSVERLAEVAAPRSAGTYWRDRDARRTSTRPIHVDVDPAAWAALKALTIRRSTTLGEIVGCLIRAELVSVDRRRGHTGEDSGVDSSKYISQSSRCRRVMIFARIASNTCDWTAFKASALEHGLTVSRAIGILVEDAEGRAFTDNRAV